MRFLSSATAPRKQPRQLCAERRKQGRRARSEDGDLKTTTISEENR